MTAPVHPADGFARDLRPQGRGVQRPPTAAPTWRLVGQFATLESAQIAAERLRLRGVVTAVSMVGGLSVIARA